MLLFLFLVPMASLALAATPPPQLQLDQLLAAETAKNQIPGGVAGVYWKGHILWVGATGWADLGSRRPVTKDIPFRLASISKPMTAVGLLALVEAGKLQLEEEIHRHCPAYPPQPYPIRIEQLLGHLGGIRHYNGPGDMNNATHFSSVTESLQKFSRDPLVHEPGTAYLYTTYGYSLLGCAMEQASGMRYERWMKEQVLDPAGMKSTFPDTSETPDPRLAAGYRKLANGTLDRCARNDNSGKLPGAGWASTAPDLLHFAGALLGGRLLSAAALERMWTSLRLKSGKLTGYGLGWSLARSPQGDRVVYHTGGQQGASTLLYLRPDRDFAFVWLTNLEGFDRRLPVAEQAFQIVVGK